MKQLEGMIIGASKSGTSSLLRYLGQHPLICTHRQNEMNFFVLDHEYEEGFPAAYDQYLGHCSREKFLLAKSAGLFYRPEAIERLRAHNPHVQVVLLLRHPVDRAHSSFWYEKRKGRELADTFEEALATNAGRLQVNWRNEKECMYLEEGCYVEFLPTLLQKFPREQLSIFLLKEMKETPQDVCQRLFAQFGLESSFRPENFPRRNRAARARSKTVAQMIVRPSVLKRAARFLLPRSTRWRLRQSVTSLNESSFTPPPMSQATRDRLLAYFEPYNRRLSDLLEVDLSSWAS